MVKVTVSSYFEDSTPVFVDENTTTVRQAINNAGSPFNTLAGSWRINGAKVPADKLDAPLVSAVPNGVGVDVRITNVPQEKNA